MKANNFEVKPHGLSGRPSNQHSKISGFTGIINDMLSKGITNTSVIFERLHVQGYDGSLNSIKVYVNHNKHLVPAKWQIVPPQGHRGRLYETGPGEAYQMDWGFVTVETTYGKSYIIACFAIICHHCGQRYIEFFQMPNRRTSS